MMLTLVALAVVMAVASVVWDGHRSGRHPFRLVQFHPVAPLAGGASTARVRAPDVGDERRR